MSVEAALAWELNVISQEAQRLSADWHRLENEIKAGWAYEKQVDVLKNESIRNRKLVLAMIEQGELSLYPVIRDVDFSGVDWSHISVKGLTFRNCVFDNCTFKYTSFSRCEFYKCSMLGVTAHQWDLECCHVRVCAIRTKPTPVFDWRRTIFNAGSISIPPTDEPGTRADIKFSVLYRTTIECPDEQILSQLQAQLA